MFQHSLTRPYKINKLIRVERSQNPFTRTPRFTTHHKLPCREL